MQPNVWQNCLGGYPCRRHTQNGVLFLPPSRQAHQREMAQTPVVQCASISGRSHSSAEAQEHASDFLGASLCQPSWAKRIRAHPLW